MMPVKVGIGRSAGARLPISADLWNGRSPPRKGAGRLYRTCGYCGLMRVLHAILYSSTAGGRAFAAQLGPNAHGESRSACPLKRLPGSFTSHPSALSNAGEDTFIRGKFSVTAQMV
jgi:hypothetical protein